jgi:hypothetical protein
MTFAQNMGGRKRPMRLGCVRRTGARAAAGMGQILDLLRISREHDRNAAPGIGRCGGRVAEA